MSAEWVAPPATQATILSAYAELIEEVGTDDVSYRLIARRAGVGERTVFRHYPTRTDLLLATATWLEQVVFVHGESGSVFDVPLSVRDAMEVYDRRPELTHVVADATMRGVSGATPSPRRGQLEALLADEVPSLAPAERDMIVAALSHLYSAATWVIYRHEFGMNRRDIADAAQWAAEAILDPIRGRIS